MMVYEVVFSIGSSSQTADLRQRVQANGPAQAQAIIEAQYPGAWVKRCELRG